ncbi:MAG TPA: peptide chain release factor N(5)-glutamine methyltransferase [Planctomycetaceae bacterium]|nr:peptide chain release factor N(5)-glutamine methyltransferase [Planctomycetaceae bacterium]
MDQEAPWTIRRLLEWTTGHFTQRGSDTPRLDAEILLAAALGIKRIELYTGFESVPGEEGRSVFREYVKRRGAGEPVAYLVGQKEFFSLPFHVTRDTLIPRPETELLVLEALDCVETVGVETGEDKPNSSPGKTFRLADVGTGSGCVAVAIAKNKPNARITAIDRSPAALQIAKENAIANGVAERIAFFESDLFHSVPGEVAFDLVVSNPPYVSEAEYAALAPNVRNYEPREALLAGTKGTETVERLIRESEERLRSGGTLLVEISPMIAVDCVRLFDPDRWNDVRLVKDDARRDRIVRGTRIDS